MSDKLSISLHHELVAAEDFQLRRDIHRAFRLRMPAIGFGIACLAIGAITGVQAGVQYGLADAVTTALPWSLLGAIWLAVGLVPFGFWSRGARIAGKHERTLDENGLHVRAGNVAIDLPWHAMRRTLETATFFLFFDAQERPHYLPKRGLRDRDIEDVRRLVAARSPESIRRLRP